MRLATGMRLACAALGSCALLLTACGGGSSGGATSAPQQIVQLPPPPASILNAIAAAHEGVAYSGRRTLWYRVGGGKSGTQALSYSEDVLSDGAGRFAIDLHDLVVPVVHPSEEDVFGLLQKSREGFAFRFRDFRIRDVTRMLQSYTVHGTGQVKTVAGRVCAQYSFQKLALQDRTYLVSVDNATSLVLAVEEYDRQGRLAASMTFDRILYAAPAAGSGYHTDLPATALVPNTDNHALLGFPLRRPTLVSGYDLVQQERIDAGGRVWARLVYHDGIEPLFFLHSGRVGHLSATSSAPAGIDPLAGVPTVRVSRAGSWTIAHCTHAGSEYVLAGKVGERELLAILRSALH